NAPFGILIVGLDSRINSANETALSKLGYAQINELKSFLFTDLISPDDRLEAVRLFFGDTLPAQSLKSLECKILTRAGNLIAVELRCLWMILPGAAVPQLVCYFNDITHHLEIEQALRLSEQRYRFLVEFQGEGVVMINAAGTIDYLNKAGGILMDGTPELIIGRQITDFIPESQLKRLETQLNNRRKGLSSSYELTLQTLSNQTRDVLVTATPRHASDGSYNGTLAIFRDITERKLLEEKLRYQSTHDTMTNLFNRSFFDETLENFDPRNSPLTGIIIVDVDGLKEVNDHDGHKAGDRLIQQVARILTASFRSSDIIARIGGDEFAILLFDTDENHLHQAILRLRHNLEQANASIPEHEQISFSIG
ncbi:MAG: diguanylate cyclase, partial [Anaerolineaceae bacterium]